MLWKAVAICPSWFLQGNLSLGGTLLLVPVASTVAESFSCKTSRTPPDDDSDNNPLEIHFSKKELEFAIILIYFLFVSANNTEHREKKTPQPFYFSVHDHMFYYKLCSKLLILYFKRMGLFRSEVCLIPGKPHVNELNHD